MVILVLKKKKMKFREVHQVSQSHTAESTVQPGKSEDSPPRPKGRWLEWGGEALRTASSPGFNTKASLVLSLIAGLRCHQFVSYMEL